MVSRPNGTAHHSPARECRVYWANHVPCPEGTPHADGPWINGDPRIRHPFRTRFNPHPKTRDFIPGYNEWSRWDLSERCGRREDRDGSGKLSEAELLRCRTRYFVDGLVIGSEGFVNGVFAMMRGYFGAKRQSGARRMRGVETSLCTMRDLQKQAVVP
ncbi:MAG: hypothetical protein P8Q54_12910 [Akkermansiaceae bacterium]|nr:hypothetical protein [Akkermansiaceae bacterium]